jgi:uncharacterized protein (DUF1330 family)
MRTVQRLTAGVAMATAFALSGTAATQAQDRPGPAYLVVEINVNDQDGFAEYAEKATATVLQYGGDFIVLGAAAQTVEGAEPDGNIVIIKFGSVDEARKWLTSPEYSVVKGIRHRTANTRQYLVEGVPQE